MAFSDNLITVINLFKYFTHVNRELLNVTSTRTFPLIKVFNKQVDLSRERRSEPLTRVNGN